MILLIDIGNSRVKWATLSQGQLGPGQSLSRPPAEAWPDFSQQAWGSLHPPRAVVVSNVAGQACALAVSNWVQQRWNLAPRFITAVRQAHGVTNAYAIPERLGADRWAILVAARQHYPETPLYVVDAGTAITIDVLNGDGLHLGGLIVPGLAMMRSSLSAGTEGIHYDQDSEHDHPATLLGRDTREGVHGGTLYAAIAVIDRVVHDVRAELNVMPTCILTGGDAPHLLPLLAHAYQHCPNLSLEGLAILGRDR